MITITTARPTRRTVLAGLAGLAAPALWAGAAHAQARTLNILSHRVHQSVITGQGANSIDVTEAWRAQNNTQLNWTTLDVAPLADRLAREASLQETSFDLAFLVNTTAVPRVLSLFETLNPWLAREPIEDWPDLFPNLVRAVSLGDDIQALPFRQATTGFHYNEAYYAERGVSAAPRTLEELTDAAKRTTFTREGTPINGFAIEGVSYVNIVTVSFAFGAPFIDENLRLLPNPAGMVRTFEWFRQMFADGVLPRNFAALRQDEVIANMQNGRLASCYFAFGRHVAFNDPQRARFPGRVKFSFTPAAREQAAILPIAGTTEFWSIVIPKRARNKELAWSLARTLMSKEATIGATLNGNGPIRASAFADPRVRERVPYSAMEAETLRWARPPLPAFDRAVEAGDVLTQVTQAVTLGRTTPEAGVEELRTRVTPLLPTR